MADEMDVTDSKYIILYVTSGHTNTTLDMIHHGGPQGQFKAT